MKTVIINVGISGSGKTTWSSNYIKENQYTYRTNRDDLRKLLVGNLEGYYKRNDLTQIEIQINNIETDLFNTLNYNTLIIDNTNLKECYINKWLMLIGKKNKLVKLYDFKFKLFDVDYFEAVERVKNRDNIEQVGYIRAQMDQYINIKNYIKTNYKDKTIK